MISPKSALREPLVRDADVEPRPCKLPASRNDLLGIGFMLAAEFLNACCNGLVKFVSAWPTERLLLIRFSIDMMISLAVARGRRLPPPAAADVPWLFLRGAAYCTGLVFFWAALQVCVHEPTSPPGGHFHTLRCPVRSHPPSRPHSQSCLPIGDVVVTVVALAPLILAVLTSVLLHEAIPRAWPVQMVLCTIGALLINKP